MIGSDGSQSAAKSGGVIIDCFFCFTCADRRFVCVWGGGRVVIGVRRGGEKLPGTGGGVLTNQHK